MFAHESHPRLLAGIIPGLDMVGLARDPPAEHGHKVRLVQVRSGRLVPREHN